MPLKYIVTHPGGAHKDDFLACCVLAHLHKVAIERRDPTDDDLADADVCVVDVGGEHEPDKNNFDHHQFPKDHPPLCALSLVLQNLGLYEDALQFCVWLRPAEWLDTKGPNGTAKEMGIPREAFSALMSPIDITLLRRFALEQRLESDKPLYQIMCMVGEDIVGYVRKLRERLDHLKSQCEYWTVGDDGNSIEVVFLKRVDPIDDDPGFGMNQFVVSEGKAEEVVALVYPDRRGGGYGLTRFEDSPRVDFSKIEACDDVRFAHKRGFVAKTDATDEGRLKELLALAIV